jgi:cob(I)alamin adenosyltransferase
MKIYTKTGDRGMTSLVGGQRVSKTDPRLESYGTIDELNAFIGLLISALQDKDDLAFLRFVQHKMFTIGSYLATDQGSTELRVESRVDETSVAHIEKEIDKIMDKLPPQKHFLLPGGSKGAALAHVCRTVCRRAERQIYRLHAMSPVEDNVLVFMNRLSDYFFALARKTCLAESGEEIIWDSSCI